MDIELARTFLAVVETGSFLSAADRVHVTQSTVSARIKSLEDQLRRPLFTRGRTGAELTQAGRHFHRHAQAMLRSWTQARLDVGLPEHLEAAIEIGAQHSLWDGYLTAAVGPLRSAFPDFAFKGTMGYPDVLLRDLTDGALDLAVLYQPEMRPGFTVQRLFEDEFVLVTSNLDPQADPLGDGYILVDWGPNFHADHALCYPAIETPAVQVGVGSLGLQCLETTPASGYFPARLVQQGPSLRILHDFPKFSYSAFAVFQDELEDDLLARIVDTLKKLAKEIT